MNLYVIIATPFISAFLAQIIKIILVKKNKMKIKDLIRLSYSGMPSGHSAFVISLATIIGLSEGFTSSLFALSLAFAVIIINDALRLRRYLGQQGAIINILIKDLKEDQFLDEKYPILRERIGHTIVEVIAGILLGLIIGILMFKLF
ncbi:MAG: divergent PAP2 family protein [Patescibacteria group bacterium]|jgi:hypothetical protein